MSRASAYKVEKTRKASAQTCHELAASRRFMSRHSPTGIVKDLTLMGGMMGWVEQPGSEQQNRAVRTNLTFDGVSKVTSTRHRR